MTSPNALVAAAGVLAAVASWRVPVRAEIPSLSPSERRQRADVIVDGRIAGLFQRVVPLAPRQSTPPTELQTDLFYTADVVVDRVLKGSGVKPGQTITVRFWRVDKRPAGWVGAGGQSRVLEKDQWARLFLRRAGASTAAFSLLLPNGWTVPPPSPRAQK